MKQIFQNYKTGEVLLEEVPVPACKAGGIVVRTQYSAISPGTELMKIAESKMSLLDKARARPDQVQKVLAAVAQSGVRAAYEKVMTRLDSLTPLGYSISGQVVEVGSGVTEFKVGDLVACAGNAYALHAEFNWVPVNLAVLLPAGTNPVYAAFGTIGAVALQGIRQARVQPGEIVCVVGLGLIGQMLVRMLRAIGARAVGVELSAERAALALAGGAELVHNPSTDSRKVFASALDAMSGSSGCDHVIIASGGASNAAIDMAPEIARDRSRVTVIGKTGLSLSWNAFYEKEMEVTFSRSYGPGRYDPNYEERGIDYPIGYVRWTEKRNLAEVLRMMANGSLDLAPLVASVHPFDEAANVFERLHAGDLTGVGYAFAYPASTPLVRQMPRLPNKPHVARARSKIVRVGAIGCGNYASSMLFPHFLARDDVQLVAVATTTAASAANAVKRFGFERVSTDPAAVLEADDVDLVVVTTRHSSHAALACAALEAGKTVFVEKPMAIRLEEVDQIRETMERSGNRRILVGFNRRYSPMMSKLKAAFGSLGSTAAVSYRVNAGTLDANSWYLDKTQGSRFVGEGGHFIDTLSWWMGSEPTEVLASRDGTDEQAMLVTLRYPNGLGTISYLTGGDPRFSKERLEIFGGGQSAYMDNFKTGEFWTGGKRRVKLASASLDKGQKAQVDGLVSAVREATELPISADSLLLTTRATLLADKAAADPGRALAI